MTYRLSRLWNRIPYAIMKIGRRMLWDSTGRNKDLLTGDRVLSEYTEIVMCDKKIKQ